MAGINKIKLKSLKQTKNFYIYELKKKGLTEKRRNEILKAKKTIEKIIKEKEESGERKHKYFSKKNY